MPSNLLEDALRASGEGNAEHCSSSGIDVYLAVGRQKHGGRILRLSRRLFKRPD